MIFNLFSRKADAQPPSHRRSHQPMIHRRQKSSRFMDAAKTDNLNAGWTTANHSADAVLRNELARVRARSRYLAVNDPYFGRFLKLCEENVVGAQGIRLQMRAVQNVKATGDVVFDDNANKLIENAWIKWTKRRNASTDQRDSFLSMQRIIVSTVARDGEIFLRKLRDPKNPFAFSLKMIEADHIPVELNKELRDGGYIRMGIEFDRADKVVAYHMMERHPGDSMIGMQRSYKTLRIPARSMVHIYVRDRASQSRGIPWGVSSMARSKMLDGYEQAELVAARVSASKMGFIISPDGESYQGDGEGVDENGNSVTITDADPGTFEQLPEGWDVKTFNPDHPSGAFGEFCKRILRGITAGFGVGYNTLTNDYEGVNFSSLRQSNLSERDFWRKLQWWLIESLHDEIFRDWLEMAMTSGALNLPLTKIEKFDSATWRPRGWTWVDPLKEMTANKMAIEMGLDSATNIIASQGRDIEEVYQDIKSEITLRQKHGIILEEGGGVTVSINTEETENAKDES